jgi:hypothetical protein
MAAGKGGKEKKLYLKDVLYQQAMEGGAAGGSDSESEGGRRRRGARDEDAAPLTYDQEQLQLKRAFLKVGGLLRRAWLG